MSRLVPANIDGGRDGTKNEENDMEDATNMLVTTTRQPDIEQTARLLMLAIDLGRGTSHPATAPDDATLDVCLLPCSPKPEAARYRVAIRAVGPGIEDAPEARIDVIAGNAVAVFPTPDAEDGWGRMQASLHDEAGTRRVVQAAIDACTRLMCGSAGETGTNPQELEGIETGRQGSNERGEA